MSTSTKGFPQGFLREIEAVLAVNETGQLTPRELRMNLKQAGVIFEESFDIPPPPQPNEEDEGA